MWNICGVVSKLNSNRKQDPGQLGYLKHQKLLLYGILTNIDIVENIRMLNVRYLHQKVLIYGFQRSFIWFQWIKSTYWAKLYTVFTWGPLEPNICQSSSKVFIWKKGRLPEDQCIAACESMVYAYMYLELFLYYYIIIIIYMYMGLLIYLWIWNGWKLSILCNVHIRDTLVWHNIQDPKF